MTSDPAYDKQSLNAHELSKSTSDTALPGNADRRDRFAQATYRQQITPPPKQKREGVAALFATVSNLSMTFGTPFKSFGTYRMEYRTVTDKTSTRCFLELPWAPNVIRVDRKTFDPRRGTRANAAFRQYRL